MEVTAGMAHPSHHLALSLCLMFETMTELWTVKGLGGLGPLEGNVKRQPAGTRGICGKNEGELTVSRPSLL